MLERFVGRSWNRLAHQGRRGVLEQPRDGVKNAMTGVKNRVGWSDK